MTRLGRLLVTGLAIAGCSRAAAPRAAPTPPAPASPGVGQAVGAGPGIVGHVRDRRGAPVKGARIAAIEIAPAGPPAPAAIIARSSFDGSFVLPGASTRTHALTSTYPGLAAAFAPAGGDGARPVELVLGERGMTLGGTVRDEAGAPLAGVVLRAHRRSPDVGDRFEVETDTSGRYALTLGPGTYGVLADAEGRTGARFVLEADADRELDLRLVSRATWETPPSRDMIEWIRRSAQPLEADADFAHVEGIAGVARVVGLGESTHGTREFFRMKQRIFQSLVINHGFEALALEASVSTTRAIDEFATTGRGDAEEAIAGLLFWTANTEEMLELVRWMRAYNAAHPARMLRVFGIDPQLPAGSARALRAYLGAVDPAFAAGAEALLGSVRNCRKDLPVELGALAGRLDSEKERYVARSSLAAWTGARHDAEVLVQCRAQARADVFGTSLRDEAMASNVLWALGQLGPRAKMAVFAHDGHVAKAAETPSPALPMGAHLQRALGDEYRAVSLLFGHGSFRAYDSDGETREPGAPSLDVPPEGFVESALAAAAMPAFALDLHPLRAEGDVARWWRAPHGKRSIGAWYATSAPERSAVAAAVPEMFDALVYVDRSTPSRPGARALRVDLKDRPVVATNLAFAGEAGSPPPGWVFPEACARGGYRAAAAGAPSRGARLESVTGADLLVPAGVLYQELEASAMLDKTVTLRLAARFDGGGEGARAEAWLGIVRAGLPEAIVRTSIPAGMPARSIAVSTRVPGDAQQIRFGVAVRGRGTLRLDAATFPNLAKEETLQ